MVTDPDGAAVIAAAGALASAAAEHVGPESPLIRALFAAGNTVDSFTPQPPPGWPVAGPADPPTAAVTPR